MSLLQSVGYSFLIINLIVGLINIFYPKITIRTKITLSILVLLIISSVDIFDKLSLVAVMDGAFSDLSITSIIILVCIFFDNLQNKNILFKKVFSRYVQLMILLLGIILYISVIGALKIDIYGFGYRPTYLILGFCFVELIYLRVNKYFAYIWLFALIGFYFNIQTSNNFWDYLFDPFLWIFTILIIAVNLIKGLRK